MKNIVLDKIIFESKKRTNGYINVAGKPDGSMHKIPIIIIEGEKPGPTLLVDGCTHGDEYEGAEAIIKIAKKLENKEFNGRFIGVPALNFEAFSFITRSSILDDINLNRVFPGDNTSRLTNKIAYTYIERVVKKVDYVISFHGGGQVLHLEPIVGYQPPVDDVGKKTYEMAKNFGVKLLWRMQNLPFTGVSAVEYKKLGIPTILPEVGSHCGRLYDREKNVKICFNGIMNTMKYLEMLDGELVYQKETIDTELHYLDSSNGGLLKISKELYEDVKKGEVLATVSDIFGKVIEEIKAPFDGILIGFWSVPVINPGDWSCLYCKKL
jgi:predicted deacylase